MVVVMFRSRSTECRKRLNGRVHDPLILVELTKYAKNNEIYNISNVESEVPKPGYTVPSSTSAKFSGTVNLNADVVKDITKPRESRVISINCGDNYSANFPKEERYECCT